MSAYVRLGPRRKWPKPQSMELTHALGCLATPNKNLAPWERKLLASVVGAYFVLVFSPRRNREADIAALRRPNRRTPRTAKGTDK